MHSIMQTLSGFLMAMALLLAPGVQAAITQDDPEQMVLQLSETIVKALNDQRVELEGNPAKIKAFAEEFVLPYVDTPKMARYVMGRYWRTTTSAQQQAFMDEFTTTLLRSYSQSLLKLNINSVTVQPKVEEKPGRVTIASEVTQADGNKSNVVYRAYLDDKTQKWMVYDVMVEGISLLLNYRKTYDSEFSKVGVDGVISSMREKNREFNGA